MDFAAVADDDSTVGDDEDLVAASADDLDERLMMTMKERIDDVDVEVDQWLRLLMAPQRVVDKQAMEGG